MACECDALLRAHDEWEPQEDGNDLISVRAWPVEGTGSVRRVVGVTWAEAA